MSEKIFQPQGEEREKEQKIVIIEAGSSEGTSFGVYEVVDGQLKLIDKFRRGSGLAGNKLAFQYEGKKIDDLVNISQDWPTPEQYDGSHLSRGGIGLIKDQEADNLYEQLSDEFAEGSIDRG